MHSCKEPGSRADSGSTDYSVYYRRDCGRRRTLPLCDPGAPTEIDLALTDVRVFLTMLRHFARPVRTLISA